MVEVIAVLVMAAEATVLAATVPVTALIPVVSRTIQKRFGKPVAQMKMRESSNLALEEKIKDFRSSLPRRFQEGGSTKVQMCRLFPRNCLKGKDELKEE
jgi:hypothetical protein